MAMTDDKAVFLDTNVLVYANVKEAPLHRVALNAIESRYHAGYNLWISRQVLREFLATLSRPQTFSNPRSISTIIDRIHFFQRHFLGRLTVETTVLPLRSGGRMNRKE